MLLGKALVTHELGINTTEGWVTVRLELFDTITVILLVLVVVCVVLRLGHLTE